MNGALGPPDRDPSIPWSEPEADVIGDLAKAAKDAPGRYVQLVRQERRRCGECYRLITTPGDHADGCSHIPPPVSR